MKKKILTVLLSLATACTVLAACGGEPQGGGEHTEHDWVLNAQQSKAATCGEGGVLVYTCECGETKTEIVPATGAHTFGSGRECSVCGYVDMSGLTEAEAIETYGFYHTDEDGGKTYSAGDGVSFGSYPQDMVEEEQVLAALKSYEGELPTAEGAGDWTSYGYYAEGEVADYAFYKDVTLDGARYRGVYLLGYRPYYSALDNGGDYSYVDNGGYELSKVYWFAYSPIRWSVLSYGDGSLFLAAKYCLEAQPFQALYEKDGDGNYVIPDTEIFVNDWEYSTLRAFLNNDFYATAFSEAEQALVEKVTLENKSYGANTVNNTQDSVFLLSYADIGTADYFVSTDKARTFTQYSVIQGLRPSGEAFTAEGDPACSYILRTAGNKSYVVAGVSKQGSRSYEGGNIRTDSDESYDNYAINGDLGVLPALYLKVGK